MRAANEYQNNASVKRGVVVDRDPAKKRAKVEFKDEDETVSFWVDVLARSSGTTKSFIMPDIDDEVWCMLDQKGEDGCIVGSKYNSKDAPPWSGNDDVGMSFPGGSVHIDRAGGTITINVQGDVSVTSAGNVTITASQGHLK